MTEVQRRILQGLLIGLAVWVHHVIRRRYPKKENLPPQSRARLGDLISPRDRNAFLRAVMVVSICISVPVWFVLFVGVTGEAGLWMVKQGLGHVPQSQAFRFVFVIVCVPLPWMVFAAISRRIQLGQRLDAVLETPTANAAAMIALLACSGVALMMFVQRHHLLMLS